VRYFAADDADVVAEVVKEAADASTLPCQLNRHFRQEAISNPAADGFVVVVLSMEDDDTGV
jgi:hypothetical protein